MSAPGAGPSTGATRTSASSARRRWRTRPACTRRHSSRPRRLGFIEGTKDVDPSAWFFKAHFYQDPVCPGSLGLESLLQLLKVVAVERWGAGPGAAFESVGLGDAHRWIYRGQVIPTHGRVTTRAVITAVDDRRRRLKADGSLGVDGRRIYQIHDFTLRLDAEGR